MNTTASTPFNNAQIELLRLFSRDLSPEELLELKRLIVRFMAQKASRAASEAMEEKGWTQKDLDLLLHQHERTPYPQK